MGRGRARSSERMADKCNGYKVGSASLANHTIRAHSTQGGHVVCVCLQCMYVCACVELLPKVFFQTVFKARRAGSEWVSGYLNLTLVTYKWGGT